MGASDGLVDMAKEGEASGRGRERTREGSKCGGLGKGGTAESAAAGRLDNDPRRSCHRQRARHSACRSFEVILPQSYLAIFCEIGRMKLEIWMAY